MGIGLDGFTSAVNVALDKLRLLDGPGGAPIPGTSMMIEETHGGHKIVLRDRSMPFQGVEFGVEARTKKTIYPGNPAASIQVLGFDNLDLPLEGEWNYRFLKHSVTVDGDPDQIKTPAQLVALFDRMCRAGRQLRVQWMNAVRIGVLKEFIPKWDRANDVKWTMKFEWSVADDETPPSPPIAVPGFGLSDFMKALNFLEDCLAIGPDLMRSFSAAIVSNIKEIRGKISKVIQAFGAIEALVNLPATILGAIDAAISSIADECSEMIRRCSGPRLSSRSASIVAIAALPLSANPSMPGGNGGKGAVQSSATQQTTIESWSRTVARAASDLRHQAIMIGVQLRAQAYPEATHQATSREGETLWSIAAREYGSSDYASYLAQANGLQGAMIQAGTTLKLPPRPYGAAIDVELTATEPPVITLTNPGACQV